MRRARFLSVPAVLLAAFVLSSCGGDNPVKHTDATAEIDWVATDVLYDQSLQKHDQSLLFIMVVWCSHCQNLKKYTLTDSSVIALINSSFNASKIDADSLNMVAYLDTLVTEHDMAHTKYRIGGYPTIIALDAGGNETKRWVGERGPDQFVNELNEILTTK